MEVTEILKNIWLFFANKMKSSESVSKQPTQLVIELNSLLRQKLGTFVRLTAEIAVSTYFSKCDVSTVPTLLPSQT